MMRRTLLLAPAVVALLGACATEGQSVAWTPEYPLADPLCASGHTQYTQPVYIVSDSRKLGEDTAAEKRNDAQERSEAPTRCAPSRPASEDKPMTVDFRRRHDQRE